MGKAPAFQFYAADFISDIHVATMSLAERGAYITLLCYCWIDGGIPDDQEKLSRLLGVNLETMGSLWRPLWGRFEKRGDLLVSPRLEKVRKQQEEYRNSQRESGIRGANARWKKKLRKNGVRHSDPNGDPNGETMAKEVEEAVEVGVGVGGKKKGVKGEKDGGGDKAVFDSVLALWNEGRDPRTRARPSDQKRRKIKARLVDFSHEDLLDAVRKVKASPWHTGQNDSGWKASFDWVFESTERVEKLLSMEVRNGGNRGSGQLNTGRGVGPEDAERARQLDRQADEEFERNRREIQERRAEEDRDGVPTEIA